MKPVLPGSRVTQAMRDHLSALRRGTRRSPETKEKIRQSKLGKKRTPETVAKIRASLIGKTRSTEIKAKMSQIHTERYAKMTHEQRVLLISKAMATKAANRAARAAIVPSTTFEMRNQTV